VRFATTAVVDIERGLRFDHSHFLVGASMNSFRVARWALLAFGVTAMGAASARGQSLGCFEMPSRVTQYFGYGYGAGHHVPIGRTPGPGPGRIPRNVTLPESCGGPYVAPYQPIGCYGEACYGARPMLEPTPVLAPEGVMSPVGPAALPAPPAPERGAWRFFRS
jgi:hypothetical protein